jgi:broad specificity phosphatase PhoE
VSPDHLKTDVLTVRLRRHATPLTGGTCLAPAGVDMARAIGAREPAADLVVSSPQLRARQTAGLIAGRLDSDLGQLDLADYLFAHFEAPWTWEQFDADIEAPWRAHGRATLDALARRAKLIDARTVQAVSHSGVVQAAIVAAGGGAWQAAYNQHTLGYAEGAVLHCEGGRWRVGFRLLDF